MSLIVNTVIFAHLFYWEVLTKLKNIMKYILPLLFIAYLGGITLFTHSHVVNGVIIVHSHPFKGQHGHTEVQLETIFYLASFVSSSFPPLPVAATVFLVLLCVLSIPATECIKCVKLRGGICLRAPPSFSNPIDYGDSVVELRQPH